MIPSARPASRRNRHRKRSRDGRRGYSLERMRALLEVLDDRLCAFNVVRDGVVAVIRVQPVEELAEPAAPEMTVVTSRRRSGTDRLTGEGAGKESADECV